MEFLVESLADVSMEVISKYLSLQSNNTFGFVTDSLAGNSSRHSAWCHRSSWGTSHWSTSQWGTSQWGAGIGRLPGVTDARLWQDTGILVFRVSLDLRESYDMWQHQPDRILWRDTARLTTIFSTQLVLLTLAVCFLIISLSRVVLSCVDGWSLVTVQSGQTDSCAVSNEGLWTV